MKTMNSLASCAFTAIVGALLLTAAPTLGQDAAPAQPPQTRRTRRCAITHRTAWLIA